MLPAPGLLQDKQRWLLDETSHEVELGSKLIQKRCNAYSYSDIEPGLPNRAH